MSVGRSGGSRTRTWDLRFWRPALPPAELIPQVAAGSLAPLSVSIRSLVTATPSRCCSSPPDPDPRREPAPTGRRAAPSAPRRLDENQLPPVQHLGDGAGL